MEVENLLSDLIKIQSVNPPGGEMEVANYLKRLFDGYRIPNEIVIDNAGRGSFIAAIGQGKRACSSFLMSMSCRYRPGGTSSRFQER